ncbi:AAEL003376-PA [Aedes aegypti]|uniref:AAEL003376-PA n=1 Tax=Aedes aegypti TaxID=7159 RepID=Q17FJ7_AEDAE|nr:AAEL003376-PA [Aedes aegypti]
MARHAVRIAGLLPGPLFLLLVGPCRSVALPLPASTLPIGFRLFPPSFLQDFLVVPVGILRRFRSQLNGQGNLGFELRFPVQSGDAVVDDFLPGSAYIEHLWVLFFGLSFPASGFGKDIVDVFLFRLLVGFIAGFRFWLDEFRPVRFCFLRFEHRYLEVILLGSFPHQRGFGLNRYKVRGGHFKDCSTQELG